jgi:hypothetical protein
MHDHLRDTRAHAMPLGLSLACRPDDGAGLNANGSDKCMHAFGAGGDERVWIDDHGCFLKKTGFIFHINF